MCQTSCSSVPHSSPDVPRPNNVEPPPRGFWCQSQSHSGLASGGQSETAIPCSHSHMHSRRSGTSTIAAPSLSLQPNPPQMEPLTEEDININNITDTESNDEPPHIQTRHHDSENVMQLDPAADPLYNRRRSQPWQISDTFLRGLLMAQCALLAGKTSVLFAIHHNH